MTNKQSQNLVTPNEHLPELAKVIGIKDLYFKREDMHPLCSHKGRSIPHMVDHYRKMGDRSFVISSSGNAALAAAKYIHSLPSDITLDIYVSNNISPEKLERLNEFASDRIRILTKERPLQALNQSVSEGSRSLRQSTDDIALVGYESLAEEIMNIPNVGSVFIGTSSGTTAQALASYFIKSNKDIQVHIVQTSSCHPIYDAFDVYDGDNSHSIADAIVDQIAYRKSKLHEVVAQTGGFAWVAQNEDISAAQNLVLKYTKQKISNNSALSVAGLMKAVFREGDSLGIAVCIIAGL